MTYVGLFDEVDLHEKVKELKKLIEEKNRRSFSIKA